MYRHRKTLGHLNSLMTLLALVLILAGTPSKATEYRVDFSAGPAGLGTYPVRTHQGSRCDDVASEALIEIGGQQVRVLGVAVVVYTRNVGPGAWGHASLRFLLCEGWTLHDVEFEAYRFQKVTQSMIEEGLFPEEPSDGGSSFDHAYLRSIRGALIWRRNEHTVDKGHYAAQLTRRRAIYETWLEVNPTVASEMYRRNQHRYLNQLETLQAKQPLDRHYRGLGDNCTTHLREDVVLADLPMGAKRLQSTIFPLVFLRVLNRNPAALRVIYQTNQDAVQPEDRTPLVLQE